MSINVNITQVSNTRKYEFIKSMRLMIKVTFYQMYVLCIVSL